MMSQSAKIQRNLAYASLALVTFCFSCLVFYKIETEYKDMINVLLGVIIAKYGSIIDYFFGSSSGSAAKSSVIEAMQDDQKKQ
jgi:hypothetical protein